jgi:hypothetical protein
MTGRGGVRAGAGRPPDRGVRKRSLTVQITPELREYLDGLQASCANTIEDTIRQTAGFRAWQKAREAFDDRP